MAVEIHLPTYSFEVANRSPIYIVHNFKIVSDGFLMYKLPDAKLSTTSLTVVYPDMSSKI